MNDVEIVLQFDDEEDVNRVYDVLMTAEREHRLLRHNYGLANLLSTTARQMKCGDWDE